MPRPVDFEEMIIRNNESTNKRARFVEDVGNQTRVIESETIPTSRYRGRARTSRSRRHSRPSPYHTHQRHYQDNDCDDYSDCSGGGHHPRSQESWSDDPDFDPVISGRGVVPSLTFHFKFSHENAEKEQSTISAPELVKQSSRQEAKDHRRQMFNESVSNVLSSRYVGGIYGREDSTAELVTKQSAELTRKPELLKWMYCFTLPQPALADISPPARSRDSIPILIPS